MSGHTSGDEWLSVQTAASEDPGRDIERRALRNALKLLGQITAHCTGERNVIRDMCDQSVSAYQGYANACDDVLGIIRDATGVDGDGNE